MTEQPAPEPVQEQPVQQPQADNAPRKLTYAQRQAMAYRAATERKYGDTLQFQVQRPRRTVNRPQPSAQQAANQLYDRQPAAQQRPRAHVQELDVRGAQGSKPMYDYNAEGGIQMEDAVQQPARQPAAQPQKAVHHAKAASGGNGGGGNGAGQGGGQRSAQPHEF